MHNFKEKECYTKWRSFGKAERPRKFGSFYDTAKKNNPETFNEEPPKEKTLTKEDKVKKIAETIDEIYKLEIEGGNWNKIAYLKRSSLIDGFLAKDNNRAAKMKPIPIPAPANPEVDKPAPNFCAACTNIKKNKTQIMDN